MLDLEPTPKPTSLPKLPSMDELAKLIGQHLLIHASNEKYPASYSYPFGTTIFKFPAPSDVQFTDKMEWLGMCTRFI
jgi:hypothetical protein